ncbi:MAG: hypothetical protein Q9225_003732 [Loekoesia sp. 1 TL-2023]
MTLTKCKKLFQIHENLNGFRDGFFRGNPGRSKQVDIRHLRRWLDALTFSCLKKFETVYVDDASTLIRIILEREKEPFSQFILYQGVRAFVKGFQTHGLFINPLMVELFLQLQQQDCSHTYLESLLQRSIESAVSNFDLSEYATYIKTLSSRASKGSLRNRRGLGEKETQSSSGGPIKAFYEYVSVREQRTPSQLLEKIQNQASGLTVEQLKEFLMSFLEEIITVADVSSVEVQECIQSLVTTYITGTVGNEPKKPSDWARPKEVKDKCYENCDDCSKMNAFLRDPELQNHTLPVKEEAWQMEHLRSQYHWFKYFKIEGNERNPVAVTKTLKWWEELHRNWESRACNALKALRKLPQTELKHCLAHQYDEIMDLRMVKMIDDFHENTSQEKRYYETTSTVPNKRLRE